LCNDIIVVDDVDVVVGVEEWRGQFEREREFNMDDAFGCWG
jgi:hypothetical protein